jgi:hypothetical protein
MGCWKAVCRSMVQGVGRKGPPGPAVPRGPPVLLGAQGPVLALQVRCRRSARTRTVVHSLSSLSGVVHMAYGKGVVVAVVVTSVLSPSPPLPSLPRGRRLWQWWW